MTDKRPSGQMKGSWMTDRQLNGRQIVEWQFNTVEGQFEKSQSIVEGQFEEMQIAVGGQLEYS